MITTTTTTTTRVVIVIIIIVITKNYMNDDIHINVILIQSSQFKKGFMLYLLREKKINYNNNINNKRWRW